jgi:type VI secretion system protein ImpC
VPDPAPPRGRADALRIDAELADFSRLLGIAPSPAPQPSPLDAMLREVMAPYIVPASSPDAAALTALVDSALSATLRTLLHHPDVQSLEAAWRSLDFIVRRCECDESLKLQVYDISAEEFAADLSSTDHLEATGLHRLLVERPAQDARLGPPSMLIGLYGFEMTPAHAELLGRIGAIAAKAHAPFIASIGADVIGVDEQTLPARSAEAWTALRALPQARFVGLTTPRFLLRTPYGRRTQTIERFAFEECPAQGLGPELLWGHSSLLAAALLGQQAREEGLQEAPGAHLSLDDMAGFVEVDADGDAVAFRSTEQLLTERQLMQLLGSNWIPVLAHKALPQVRLGGFGAVGGQTLAGPWSTQDAQR